MKNRRNIHGVTLMEVLISIFVVSIGLLGVAALIPLAGHQTEQGSRNDRKANVGRRSFREFMVRGYNDPGNSVDFHWVANTGGRDTNGDGVFDDGDGIVFVDSVAGFGSQRTLGNVDPVVLQDVVGYCIDPLFVAADVDLNGAGNDQLPAASNQASYFPHVPSSSVSSLMGWGTNTDFSRAGAWLPVQDTAPVPLQLPRVSLTYVNPISGNREPIANALAEDLFYFRDDLNFDLPEDNQSNATQVMLGGQKRDAAENYSWFATLTPAGGQWVLSTVIVRNRNLTVDTSLATGGYVGLPLGEITGVISNNSLPATNESGYYSLDGDVRIDWGPSSWPNVAQLEDGIPPGAWVFVIADDPTPANVNTFNWYRVSAAGDVQIEADSMGIGHALQDVTLVGPPLTEANMMVGYVIGTEAVYQKTIHVGL